MRAGWREIARNGGSLVDPMCGSGTFLVEGAMIAGDVAPGLLRDYYGFLGWAGFDPKPWGELLAEALERRMRGLAAPVPVFGFDADPRAVDAARANVRRAELAGKILVERRELSALTRPQSLHARPAAPRAGAEGAAVVLSSPAALASKAAPRDPRQLWRRCQPLKNRTAQPPIAAASPAAPPASASLGGNVDVGGISRRSPGLVIANPPTANA